MTADNKLYEWDVKDGVKPSDLKDVRDASAYATGACVLSDGGATVSCRSHDHPELAKVAFSR